MEASCLEIEGLQQPLPSLHDRQGYEPIAPTHDRRHDDPQNWHRRPNMTTCIGSRTSLRFSADRLTLPARKMCAATSCIWRNAPGGPAYLLRLEHVPMRRRESLPASPRHCLPKRFTKGDAIHGMKMLQIILPRALQSDSAIWNPALRFLHPSIGSRACRSKPRSTRNYGLPGFRCSR